MKKIYLLTILIATAPFAGFSQITVNSNNLLDNGEPISMGYDDDVSNESKLNDLLKTKKKMKNYSYRLVVDV